MLDIIILHWGQWEDSFGYTDPSISITVRILTDILFYLLFFVHYFTCSIYILCSLYLYVHVIENGKINSVPFSSVYNIN